MPSLIIDTHIHIWDLQRAAYPWLENDTSILNRTYDIGMLEPQLKEAGVGYGVLVQASGNAEDTTLMLETAAQKDWIRGVVGWLPLLDPEKTMQVWNHQYASNEWFKGVRHQIHDEPNQQWLLQPQVMESLNFLASKNIPYDLVGVLPEHMVTALQLAEKIPSLQMVFDHLNQPPIRTKERFGKWGELMREAAAHQGFHAKISGLGTCCNPGFGAEDLLPYLDFMFTHFGVDRCFCGGDWPVSMLASSYSHVWQVYQQAIRQLLSEADAEKVLFTNANNFYHLNITPSSWN